MFNRMKSHTSGTGIASARKNKYGKIWYGSNHLESVNKCHFITIAGKQVQLSPRRYKFLGNFVPIPADHALSSKYKAEIACGNL